MVSQSKSPSLNPTLKVLVPCQSTRRSRKLWVGGKSKENDNKCGGKEREERRGDKKILCIHWLLTYNPYSMFEGAVKVAWLSVSCEAVNMVVTSNTDLCNFQYVFKILRISRYTVKCHAKCNVVLPILWKQLFLNKSKWTNSNNYKYEDLFKAVNACLQSGTHGCHQMQSSLP